MKAPTHIYGEEKRAIVNTNDDACRRKKRFANLIRGKTWLDIGAGSGAILDQLAPIASDALAVEPQEQASQTLSNLGYKTYRRLEDVREHGIECISLFHVLEHLEDPLGVLASSHSLLKEGGRIIIEVPHASDLLIKLLDWKAFKDFTFWSEHLVLHTRFTLEALVKEAGFNQIVIEGVQRYPVANHLSWLSSEKPGGHVKFDFMRDDTLDNAYAAMLQRLDMTDTLVLTAVK